MQYVVQYSTLAALEFVVLIYSTTTDDYLLHESKTIGIHKYQRDQSISKATNIYVKQCGFQAWLKDKNKNGILIN